MKSGNLNFLEPYGPLQACNGTALLLPLPLPSKIVLRIMNKSVGNATSNITHTSKFFFLSFFPSLFLFSFFLPSLFFFLPQSHHFYLLTVGVEGCCCNWSHSDAPHSIGLLWTSDRPVPENSTWQHTTLTTDIQPCHPLPPIRDSNHQSQQSSGHKPTP